MIDFVKIQVKECNTIKKIYDSERLVWYTSTNQLNHFDFETINSKEVKIYKGILFCFRENYLDILFRPHYYFNNNLHNANDFSVNDCISVFKEFISDFDITDYKNYKIVNIEFGLNFRMDKYGKDLITFLEYHKKDQFRTDTELPYSKKSYSIDRNGRANMYKTVKAYCKGLQFPKYCDINTLRLEIKSKRAKYINTLNIYNIGDFLNPLAYDKMKFDLIDVIEKLLILDNNTDFKNLTNREQTKLKEYINTFTWYNALQKSRNTFGNKRDRYFNLLDKTNYNVHRELKNIIENKLEELAFVKIETCAYSTPQKKIETCAYSTIYKGGICTHKNIRKCRVTRIDISMQKAGSILLSHTGLKHYYNNNKKEYDRIKNKYLSKKWIDADLETQIKELAHNIRNKSNNLKTRLKQNPNQVTIF